MKKSAFTMIELIFAIVVIAITVMSLPMMNEVNSKGIEGNLAQEAIFAASTELNQAVTYFWDENSSESGASLSRVIWISSTDCDNDTKLRPGHINQKLHRRCRDDNSSRPTNTSDSNLNDLDDTNKTNMDLFIGDSTTASGYKKDYKLDLEIANNIDFGGTGDADIQANIKRVRVIIKDNSGNIITRLDTFSCNIGEVDFHKRDY